MSDIEFFDLAFGDLSFLLGCMTLVMAIFYLSIRKKTIAGYLDPFHFYWTFTMGSAYGIVFFMYLAGKIETYLLLVLVSYCFAFICVFSFFMVGFFGSLELQNFYWYHRVRGDQSLLSSLSYIHC